MMARVTSQFHLPDSSELLAKPLYSKALGLIYLFSESLAAEDDVESINNFIQIVSYHPISRNQRIMNTSFVHQVGQNYGASINNRNDDIVIFDAQNDDDIKDKSIIR